MNTECFSIFQKHCDENKHQSILSCHDERLTKHCTCPLHVHLVKQLPGVSPPNRASLLPLSLTATKQSVEIKQETGPVRQIFMD